MLGDNKKLCTWSLYSLSDLPSGPPWGDIGSIKCRFCVLTFIFFIIAFADFECRETRMLVIFTPVPPLGSNWGYKITDFLVISHLLLLYVMFI